MGGHGPRRGRSRPRGVVESQKAPTINTDRTRAGAHATPFSLDQGARQSWRRQPALTGRCSCWSLWVLGLLLLPVAMLALLLERPGVVWCFLSLAARELRLGRPAMSPAPVGASLCRRGDDSPVGPALLPAVIDVEVGLGSEEEREACVARTPEVMPLMLRGWGGAGGSLGAREAVACWWWWGDGCCCCSVAAPAGGLTPGAQGT